MKKLVLGVFVFGIFSLQSSIAFATDYNYLPADVLIKQQEEKSALEYRLQNLEAGLSGNSSAYISSLSSRISQLESERVTEKNYISGTYGKYGIGNQLPAKLAEIDSKYDTQISALQSQKASYQSDLATQQLKKEEINNLKLQIAQLRAQIVDQELQANLKALEKYQNPTPVVYSDADVYEYFLYLDSLSIDDASDFFQRLKIYNLDAAKRVTTLYNNKYPNGKPGTGKYEDYLATLIIPEPIVIKEIPSIQEKKVVQKAEEVKTPVVVETKKEIQDIVASSTTKEVVSLEKPVVVEKEGFVQKVKHFFGRLFGWNK